jgi:hypothetical protein
MRDVQRDHQRSRTLPITVCTRGARQATRCVLRTDVNMVDHHQGLYDHLDTYDIYERLTNQV